MKKACATALLALVITSNAGAQSLFWRTDGTAGTWTGINWSAAPSATGGTGWTAGDAANFTALSTVTYVTTTLFSDVTVSDGVTATVTAAGTQTAGTHDYNIGTGSLLTWTGQSVSTAAASNFIKDGAGTWNIGAQGNAYAGSFTLNAGTVIVSGNNSFGGGTSALTINGGTIQTSGTRSFAPTGITFGGNFAVTGTGNATWGGTVALGTAVRTITNTQTSGSSIFSGIVSSGVGGGLGVSGTGVVVLSNAGNTYGGGTTLNGGTLSIAVDGNIGGASSAITFNGGTLQITGTALTNFGSHAVNFSTFNGGLDINAAANTFTVSQSLGGGGMLTKLGAGTLALTNSNTYAGGTLINAGTLQALADGALGTGNVSISSGTVTLTLSSGATNNYIGDSANLSIVTGTGTVALSYSGTDTIGALIINGVAQAPGQYGAVGSGATNQNAAFSGTGFLDVTATAVPEPATWMLMGVGLLVGAQRFRRKQ